MSDIVRHPGGEVVEAMALASHDDERAGTPIGGNDLSIAAHAVTLGAAVVTDNEREFRRVPEPTVFNWLRK